MTRQKIALSLLIAAIPLIAVLPLPDFWIAQLNYIGLYALVSMGLVLLTGVGGLTSFGQAAFVGIGAYTTAWLTLNTGMQCDVTVQTRANPEPHPIPADPLPAGGRNAIEYVLGCIARGAPLTGPLDPAVSLTGQRIVDTAALSAREKRTLPLVP